MEKDDLRLLKGIGPSVETKLNALDIFNQADLLFHLPSRYEDRTIINKIGALEADKEVQVELFKLCISHILTGFTFLK